MPGLVTPEDLAGHVGELDRLAGLLVRGMQALSLPLARSARAWILRKGWFLLGYARLADHARERLGRSGRWVRDLAALGEGIERLPDLATALCGEDGSPAIGRVAALLVSRCATDETLEAWVRLARRVPVRELRERVVEALAANREKDMVLGASEAETTSESGGARAAAVDSVDDGEDLVRVAIRVSRPLRAAFEEAHGLHAALEGSDTSTASFVEALVGEASAGSIEVNPFSEAAARMAGLSRASLEKHLAESSAHWQSLGAAPRAQDLCMDAGPEAALARQVLQRARFLCRWAGEGDARELDEQLRALIALEDDLERVLGVLLAKMADRHAWRALRFAGVGHYGEQRLGLSRSSAESRAWLARSMRRSPALRASYENGRTGLEAALLLARLFDRIEMPIAEQRSWAEHAESITIRRLRDEVSHALGMRDEGRVPGVPSDEEWHASLRRDPGRSRERVRRLCEQADGVQEAGRVVEGAPDVFPALGQTVTLRLRLPRDLASHFLALTVFPGLASLLVDFVETWDISPTRISDRVYIRDGWRCTAPGCSSRRNLEDHHIRYRSRGGDDSLRNRTCLCRFHHQQGEHGGLMQVTGTAPGGLSWVLGKGGCGGAFLNDRAI